MQSQLVVTAENHLIEELKTVIEGFIGQHQDKADAITIETKPQQPMVYDDIRQLKGILNKHYPKPLTDEDIKNGIHQGIMQRTMMS